jgi:hypothetical protein
VTPEEQAWRLISDHIGGRAVSDPIVLDDIQGLVVKAMAEEREACAKVADRVADDGLNLGRDEEFRGACQAGAVIAAAIRARATSPPSPRG